MKSIALITASLLLYGCVFPYPHNNWKTPMFIGIVSSAETGEPVAGAKVFYESKPEIYALTDQNGYYELMPQKEFELFAVVLPTAHPIPRVFNLVVVSKSGGAIVEAGSCIGDPGFECNGRTRELNFNVR